MLSRFLSICVGHLVAMFLWTSYIISLYLSFLICTVGEQRDFTHLVIQRIKQIILTM